MEGVSPRRGSRKALRKSWHWRASGFPCGTPTVLAVSWERLPKESALFLKSGCKISLKSGTFSILKKNFRIIRIFRSSHTGLCLWYSLRVKMTVFLGFIHWGGGETDQNELGGGLPKATVLGLIITGPSDSIWGGGFWKPFANAGDPPPPRPHAPFRGPVFPWSCCWPSLPSIYYKTI